MEKKEIEEMIQRHKIALETKYDRETRKDVPTGRLRLDGTTLKTTADKDAIRAAKPEIIAYFMAEREAAERELRERQAKVDAIEGLQEIRDAMAAVAKWHQAFQASFEGEGAVGGLGVGKKPTVNIQELKNKYPRAAAYLLAEDWSFAANFVKSSAGSTALEEIINGEDYNAAIDEMQKKWSEHCKEHIWD